MFTKNQMNGNGFMLTFDNGYEVSVNWMNGNYCNEPDYSGRAKTAEVAIFHKDDEKLVVYDFNDEGRLVETDRTQGWMTANDVAKIINRVARYFDAGCIESNEANTGI